MIRIENVDNAQTGSHHTGSRIEAEMKLNVDRAIELKSQVAELRDYLIGTRGVNGRATLNPVEPEGLFGRLSEANVSQAELLGDISDIILEIRNYF